MVSGAEKSPGKETIPLEEAKRAVELTSYRLGLLHLSFAKTIVEELGEEKGKQLILKAIKDYATRVTNRIRKTMMAQDLAPTLENYRTIRDLPSFGMHSKHEVSEVGGERRSKAWDCAMAKVWHEEGEDELGRLYCLTDPAKYMAFDPRFKLVHLKAVPDGDAYCELTVRPTTEKERQDFAEDKGWSYLDFNQK